MRRLIHSILAVSLLCASAAAMADATGKWQGKVIVDADKATQDKIMAQTKGKVPSVSLELRKDKTFKAVQQGGPDNAAHTVEGTWSQSGSNVVLKATKRDGKAATGQGASPKTYTVSKDGKTLSLDLTSQIHAQAPKSGGVSKSLKVRIVLKKV